MRVGLACGSVLTRAGDLFGPTVNLASRATALARPGTVLICEDLFDERRPTAHPPPPATPAPEGHRVDDLGMAAVSRTPPNGGRAATGPAEAVLVAEDPALLAGEAWRTRRGPTTRAGR